MRDFDIPSGVLGKSSVIVVHNAGFRVKDNIFQDGAELDRIVNVRLFLCGKTNALGITLIRGSAKLADVLQDHLLRPQC